MSTIGDPWPPEEGGRHAGYSPIVPGEPERHGFKWDAQESMRCQLRYTKFGLTITQIAFRHKRKKSAIEARLCTLLGNDWELQRGKHITNLSTPPQEQPEMNVPGTTTPNIETKVFIRGQDAKVLDVNAIVGHMTAIQNHIATLKVVQTPSEAIKKMIADGEKDLADIAKYLDSRG